MSNPSDCRSKLSDGKVFEIRVCHRNRNTSRDEKIRVGLHAREDGQVELADLYDRSAAQVQERAELVRRAVKGHETLSRDKLDET
jgi:hypothetical protein